MREPWRTMFDGYENHWLLAKYLEGEIPDWEGLAAEERLDCLSTGEKIFVDFAASFELLGHLDTKHRTQIAQAILISCESW